jgi:hypothetical protein
MIVTATMAAIAVAKIKTVRSLPHLHPARLRLCHHEAARTTAMHAMSKGIARSASTAAASVGLQPFRSRSRRHRKRAVDATLISRPHALILWTGCDTKMSYWRSEAWIARQISTGVSGRN